MSLLTREQLEERLSSLHRASLELVSELSLATLLERIVKLAKQEVGAKYAALGVFDESGSLVQFIPVGMSEDEIKKVPHYPKGLGLLGALKQERKTLRIADIQKDPRSVGFPSGHPVMRTFLGVPILLGEQLLGQIYLTDKVEAEEFTEQDERVIETLAAYAAVAIHNARLIQALTERDRILTQKNQDLTLINTIASALTRSLDLNEILQKTLTSVMEYLKVENGEIYLKDENGMDFRLVLHQGKFDESLFTRDVFRLGEGIVGEVAESGRPYVSKNVGKEVHYLRQKVFEEGCRWVAAFPLVARGSVIGVMVVAHNREMNIEMPQMELLEAITSWAGITIENVVLQQQAQRLAVLEERERIGMDLHDGIIQSIYAVGLALDYARVALEEDPQQAKYKIEQAIDGLNKTIRDIRAYILDLRPRELYGNNLIQNLNRLVDEYRVNTLSEATLIAPEDGIVGLPVSHATALFHICQEALANVAKHAHARRVEVRLWSTRDRVLLEVSDDGKGFDLRKMSVTLGHGLSNMHIRARKVGGDVEITSAPGEGTTVLAWVPKRK
ncbi:MAG: GAF domain-containing sensor histidine kinase [Anaerolineales bacterium]|nr:GAF domain-containing sensor histidine kinase [Anaerolineales bacterium]MDW8160779.1 GAF domain-containing sensor histidine kinase [Anaerolineales bacterium]